MTGQDELWRACANMSLPTPLPPSSRYSVCNGQDFGPLHSGADLWRTPNNIAQAHNRVVANILEMVSIERWKGSSVSSTDLLLTLG